MIGQDQPRVPTAAAKTSANLLPSVASLNWCKTRLTLPCKSIRLGGISFETAPARACQGCKLDKHKPIVSELGIGLAHRMYGGTWAWVNTLRCHVHR